MKKVNNFATSRRNYKHLLLRACKIKTNICHWLVSDFLHSLILNISVQPPEVRFSFCLSDICIISRPPILFHLIQTFSFLSLLISAVIDNSGSKSSLFSRSTEISEFSLSHYSRGSRVHSVSQTACPLIHYSAYSLVAVNTSLSTITLGVIKHLITGLDSN